MSNIVNNQRIRLALDLTQPFQTPTDEISGSSPVIANGVDLQFEMAFSYGAYASDAQVVSLANWATLTVALKPFNGRGGLPYWSSVIGAASLNNGLTFANWSAGTDQACVVQVPNTENTLIVTAPQTSYWLEVSAQTFSTSTMATAWAVVSGGTGYVVGDVITVAGGTSSQLAAATVATTTTGGVITSVTIAQPGSYSAQPSNAVSVNGGHGSGATFNLTWAQVAYQVIPVACFPVVVVDAGIYLGAPAYVTTPTYYTAAQSDARYLLAANLNSYAPLAGATFTGLVTLPSTQMSGSPGSYVATTKAYVDAGDAATAAASVPNTGTSTVAGLKTFSSLLTASAGLTVSGTTTLATSISGVLVAASGVVSGSATTSNLSEGSNLYFTTARVLATALTGYTATSGTIVATDTILQAVQKIGYYIAYAPAGATVWAAASQAAMLALSSALKGDLAFRSDTSTVWVLGSGSYATLASWNQLLYPVASVNGATGAVSLTADNIPESGSPVNEYFTTARANAAIAAQRGVASGVCGLDSNALVPWSNLPPLAGYSSTTGTITTTSTIVQAISILNGNLAATANPLTALLTGYSSTTGTISSSDTILSAIQKLNGNTAALLPLAGGTLTGTLTAQNVNVGSAYNYQLNGTSVLYLASTRPKLDLSGSFGITTSGSFATMFLGYSGAAALSVDQSNNVLLTGVLKMNTSQKVIDGSNYFYDSSANQILSSRQSTSLGTVGTFSPVGGWTDSTAYTDFSNLVSAYNALVAKFNTLTAALITHGLVT